MEKYVYRITNEVTGWIYVGQTCNNPLARWKTHISLLKSGKHSSACMIDDFEKYGERSFIFDVVGDFDTSSEMMDVERRLIQAYSETGKCYNFQNSTREMQIKNSHAWAMRFSGAQLEKGGK